MNKYLAHSEYIDFDHPLVAGKAAAIASTASGQMELVKSCFEFVRDEIQHSWDYKKNPVTCKASEVLINSTGYCYAKSHLLAALLRANGVPTGFCYQRLSVGESGSPYSLHGLNAVFLSGYGWYRVDARGNKEGVTAEFSPPIESLAFPIRERQERDLPEIWPEPLPIVISTLEQFTDIVDVHANLPDVPLAS